MSIMIQQWDAPRKYVIVATPRSGGTFLCHCLDSHPDIGCERDEPIRFKDGVFQSVWIKEFGYNFTGILSAILNRPGYLATCVRLNYREYGFIDPAFWQEQQVKFIHLHRKNTLRAVVSSKLVFLSNRGEIDHPVHAYQSPEQPTPITIDVEEAYRTAVEYEQKVKAITAGMGDYLALTYEELPGLDGFGLNETVINRLCEYFEVDWHYMSARLRPVNPFKLSKMLTNWNEFKARFTGTHWEKFLINEE